jgi:hypothetical protein
MSPSWIRIADEVESLARDRGRAAEVEPDEGERRLLLREAALLARAAAMARADPGDGLMIQAACAGIVVDGRGLMMWGISQRADDDLRALAVDPGVDPAHMDARALLALVVGAPADGVRAADPAHPSVVV